MFLVRETVHLLFPRLQCAWVRDIFLIQLMSAVLAAGYMHLMQTVARDAVRHFTSGMHNSCKYSHKRKDRMLTACPLSDVLHTLI